MHMVYRNLRHAFLFEASVGFITLLAVSVYGPTGIFFIALLSLRPLTLKREKAPSKDRYWRTYYDILRISIGITALSILFTFLATEYGLITTARKEILFVSVIPWYMVTHGFVGYFLIQGGGKDE